MRGARRFADLTVGGDIDFAHLPAAAGPPDIVIRRGDVPAASDEPIQQWTGDADTVWMSISRAATGFRVTLPDLASLVARDGRAVTFQAAPALDASTLDHLLLHQVLPLALSRTGRFVLHACAVDTPAGAVAFIGESGAGKSTLAAACCRRGFALVADDALAVDLHEAAPAVWPTADGVRLWHDMREAAPAGAPLTAIGTGKLRAPVALASGRVPLARLYLLETGDAVSVQPLSPAVMRIEMLSHVFRLDVGDRAESARLFDAANRAAAAVPSRRVCYPDGLAFLDAAVDAVLRDCI
jgi:hypothetical protein